MTNVDCSPLKTIFFKKLATSAIERKLRPKIPIVTSAAFNPNPKNMGTIAVITAIRAAQGIKGTTTAVVIRSFSSSIIRVPMMPGMLHPNPAKIVRNALPGNPKQRMIRSMTKAPLARYPTSSKMP